MQSETPYSLRVKAGYQKVKTLAAASGVGARTIRKYEKGAVQREDDLVHEAWEKIAKVLGVTSAEYQLAVYGVRQQRASA